MRYISINSKLDTFMCESATCFL